ncbi:MAG: hypothetical protein JEZ06_13540 [Anaerolineaceae bacterium]|nr:hypothetical protein [Anaerolineaceae bacterium]
MKKPREIIKSPDFQVFLFLLGFFLFGKPFLDMITSKPDQSSFLFLLLTWSILIILLFVISIFVGEDEGK